MKRLENLKHAPGTSSFGGSCNAPRRGRMISRLRATLGVVLAGCSDSGPSSPPQEVVVYTSVDEVFARPIAERFERRNGRPRPPRA